MYCNKLHRRAFIRRRWISTFIACSAHNLNFILKIRRFLFVFVVLLHLVLQWLLWLSGSLMKYAHDENRNNIYRSIPASVGSVSFFFSSPIYMAPNIHLKMIRRFEPTLICFYDACPAFFKKGCKYFPAGIRVWESIALIRHRLRFRIWKRKQRFIEVVSRKK